MRQVGTAAGWPVCFVGGAADGGSLPSPVAGSRGGLGWSAEQAGGGGAEGGMGLEEQGRRERGSKGEERGESKGEERGVGRVREKREERRGGWGWESKGEERGGRTRLEEQRSRERRDERGGQEEG